LAIAEACWREIASTVIEFDREFRFSRKFQRDNVRLMELGGLMPCCNIAAGGRASFLTALPDYRRYAQACLEMADTTDDEHTRAVFVQMAQVWFRLAEEKTVQPKDPKTNAD
jgi:hypothetical protein